MGKSSDIMERKVKVISGDVILNGDLSIPKKAKGIVIFIHGSGSSRLSPRNRFVASFLYEIGLATLLFDLLTDEEKVEDKRFGRYRFDIEMLAGRLIQVNDWLGTQLRIKDLKRGYFGTSTGVAASFVAAVKRPELISAIVARGGRPDLASRSLPRISAPTLLIVGGRDFPIIEVNRSAMERLSIEKELAIVPGATHLFEEPGALKNVARLAADWFIRYLR